jgi:hypothetical protein
MLLSLFSNLNSLVEYDPTLDMYFQKHLNLSHISFHPHLNHKPQMLIFSVKYSRCLLSLESRTYHNTGHKKYLLYRKMQKILL